MTCSVGVRKQVNDLFIVKPPKNVLETAQELGAHEFVRYVRQHGLYDLLTCSGGPYTIFVPTDEAFAVY